MKFLKAYWMLILAAIVLIAMIYYCYDYAQKAAVLEARMNELNAMG
ncbi:hypothetical protein [Flavobacterium suncheonense]